MSDLVNTFAKHASLRICKACARTTLTHPRCRLLQQVYDAACLLKSYWFARQPQVALGSKILVDKLHFGGPRPGQGQLCDRGVGHTACSLCFDAASVPGVPELANTQAAEQLNAHLRPHGKQIHRMSLDGCMLYVFNLLHAWNMRKCASFDTPSDEPSAN